MGMAWPAPGAPLLLLYLPGCLGWYLLKFIPVTTPGAEAGGLQSSSMATPTRLKQRLPPLPAVPAHLEQERGKDGR